MCSHTFFVVIQVFLSLILILFEMVWPSLIIRFLFYHIRFGNFSNFGFCLHSLTNAMFLPLVKGASI